MRKWTDKHIYDWYGAVHSAIRVHEKLLEFSLNTRNVIGFTTYMLVMLFGYPVLYFICGIFAILQTFEWLMSSLSDLTDELINADNKILLGIPLLPVVVMYALTWCLPGAIYDSIQRKKERKKDWMVTSMPRYTPPPPRRTSRTTDEVMIKDFKPKQTLKTYKFVTESNGVVVNPHVIFTRRRGRHYE